MSKTLNLTLRLRHMTHKQKTKGKSHNKTTSFFFIYFFCHPITFHGDPTKLPTRVRKSSLILTALISEQGSRARDWHVATAEATPPAASRYYRNKLRRRSPTAGIYPPSRSPSARPHHPRTRRGTRRRQHHRLCPRRFFSCESMLWPCCLCSL